ncbi:ketol-acid reductoisomerase [Halobacteriales archaeon QH_8_67_36]|nr:MAG: ketol-acid reductoisomerase [Halobacteriales archaeon QH_8_67_36]
MTDELNTTVYDDADADVSHVTDETVAVLGYGSQGHAHALNLHDSGVDVIVGLREGSSSREDAEASGLTVKTPDVAAAEADRVVMLVPDTVQPAVYEAISDGLEPGDTLQFAHGFNVHYGQIEPQEGVDVTMVAPKSPGHLVRRTYDRGEGTPGLIAVYQDATGTAKEGALSYAKAIGCTRAGVIETTFQCLNELKLIVDLMYEGGHMEMWNSVSDTAEYGGLTRGAEVINREGMEDVLDEIQNGEFAREWITENRAGRPSYEQYRQAEQDHEIERVGDDLRSLFSWGEDEQREEAPADD